MRPLWFIAWCEKIFFSFEQEQFNNFEGQRHLLTLKTSPFLFRLKSFGGRPRTGGRWRDPTSTGASGVYVVSQELIHTCLYVVYSFDENKKLAYKQDSNLVATNHTCQNVRDWTRLWNALTKSNTPHNLMKCKAWNRQCIWDLVIWQLFLRQKHKYRHYLFEGKKIMRPPLKRPYS